MKGARAMSDLTVPTGRFARLGAPLARAALVLAAACGLAMLLAGLGYRQHWWGVGSGIRILMGATVGALLAALIAAIAGVAGWRAASRPTVAWAFAGLVLGALLAVPPLLTARQSTRVPAIHDITTDTEDPPRFVAVVALRAGANPLDYRPEVAAEQRRAYPDLAPALLDMPPASALLLAHRAVQALGWEIVTVSPDDLRIEATATTRLFGFKDDIVVRIRPAPQGSRLDIRSVSRVGRSDLGVNAQRIRAYLAKLEELRRGG
jgi:uncharacterized protein (DUF1499 family)